MTNNNETNQNYASHDSVETSTEEVLNTPAKRKRTRVVKKDAVYTVNGMDAEILDTVKQRRTAKKKIQDSQLPLFGEIEEGAKTEDGQPTAQHPSELFKPHRGRKSKAELAAIAAWEAQNKNTEEEVEEAQENLAENTEEETQPVNSEETQEDTIAQGTEEEQTVSKTEEEQAAEEQQELVIDKDLLEAAMNRQQNIPSPTTDEEEDFIIIEDIPVEDFGMITNYDMLDNPINVPKNTEHKPTATEPSPKQKFNFDDLIKGRGVLEMMPDGYGFLRSSEYNYISSPDDVYVSNQMVKKFGLKVGDVIECNVRPPMDGEKFFTLTGIDFINGRKPHEVRDRIPFEHLTPLFPDVKYTLCGDKKTTNISTRIVDLFSPIGKGQRALIVAQPKTGKTILMKDIANAIAANHPEAYLMMLLIDERPEEVTDMARTVNAEVIASTFDEPADKHVKIAGLVLEKAKRMVECGHDVVIFLDSITRLARAYNTVAPASGKVLTGGVDANALQKPKRFFGAARNIEGGGSLTIIATALIDTGSKMDEVIFEEFKGTGNMELQLERALSNKRIFPAVNLVQSSTRRDDLLHDKNTLDKMWIMRKYIADMNAIEAMNIVQQHMSRTHNNEEFLMSMNS